MLLHHQMLLQLCKDLGLVVNWEKSDLELTQRAQYLEMKLDHPREGVTHKLSDKQILGLSKDIPGSRMSDSEHVADC